MKLLHLETPDGFPDTAAFIDSPAQLSEVIDFIEQHPGALAVDTERASAYRYDDRAFLIQIYAGSGPVFILDAERLEEELIRLAPVMNSREWILHAAESDLPALTERGLTPHSLFDTFLSASILGLEGLNLGALVEQYLGVQLRKDHGNEDWSHRPLPTDWLEYSALDVVFLHYLQQELTYDLKTEGRLHWLEQESEYRRIKTAVARPAPDFTALKSIQTVKNIRHRAVAHALWAVREDWAQDYDIPAETLLASAQIIDASKNAPFFVLTKNKARKNLPYFKPTDSTPLPREFISDLHAAYLALVSTPDYLLPDVSIKHSNNAGKTHYSLSYPPPKTWKEKSPRAQRDFQQLYTQIQHYTHQLGIETHILVKTRELRFLVWNLRKTPQGVLVHADAFANIFAEYASETELRPWQIQELLTLFQRYYSETYSI